jgi:hypothetical protein
MEIILFSFSNQTLQLYDTGIATGETNAMSMERSTHRVKISINGNRTGEFVYLGCNIATWQHIK